MDSTPRETTLRVLRHHLSAAWPARSDIVVPEPDPTTTMPSLLIDMPSGIAGDMLLGALVGCGGDVARMREDLLVLGLGPIGVTATRVQVGGLAAWRVEVEAEQGARWSQGDDAAHAHSHAHVHGDGDGGHHHHHHEDLPKLSLKPPSAASTPPVPASTSHHVHRPYRAIRELIAAAALAPRVKERSQRVFRLLAEAEGAVHGVAADEVEFHEVGAIDAIADVVGCCLLLEQLAIDEVVASSIVPGHGTVRCAHGLMPVPVPAVAAMLASTGAPMRALSWETGELTTPTGCALVCGLATRFIGIGIGDVATPDGKAPSLSTEVGTWRVLASGFGAGGKRIPGLVNAVRCTLVAASTIASADQHTSDCVVEIVCQVDDATGEQLAALVDEMLSAGALDAFLTPVVMKKGRPGHLITLIAPPAERERLSALLLSRSSSIGVRFHVMARQTLPRHAASVMVAGHVIALKVVTLPDGGERAKPEADDVGAAARALSWSFARVQEEALRAWSAGNGTEPG